MTTYIAIATILFLFAYLGWMIGFVQGWKAGEQVYEETLAELDQVKAERDGYKAPFTALNKQLQDRFVRVEAGLFYGNPESKGIQTHATFRKVKDN